MTAPDYKKKQQRIARNEVRLSSPCMVVCSCAKLQLLVTEFLRRRRKIEVVGMIPLAPLI